jgi:hypothetical protein
MADWMKDAVKHPGSFSKAAAKAGESTQEFAKEKAHAPGVLGKRARLAKTFAKFRPGKHK